MARSILEKTYKVMDQKEVIEVTLNYALGGVNCLNGNTDRRGYYLYVKPVIIEDRGGYVSKSFVLFDGFKVLIKEVARKSKKAEEEAVEEACKVMDNYAIKMAMDKGWMLAEEALV